MEHDLSARAGVRALALEMACAVAPCLREPDGGRGAGHILSVARMFEDYVATGVPTARPRQQSGFQAGMDGVSVFVEGDVEPWCADAVGRAVRQALAEASR